MAEFDPDLNGCGWRAPELTLRRAKRSVPLLSAANAVISVLTGVCPTGVTRDRWVGFAATAALAALMAEVIGAVRFCMAQETPPEQQCRSIRRMLRWGALYHLLLMAVAAAAGVIACVRNFIGPLDLAAVAGMALSALCSYWTLRCTRSL